MKFRTLLVPLTMPVVLAACLGGGGGGGGGGNGGSGFSTPTSLNDIGPNQNVRLSSNEQSVNYNAGVDAVTGDIATDGTISNSGAELRIRTGEEDAISGDLDIIETEVTVDTPDGPVVRKFDGNPVPVAGTPFVVSVNQDATPEVTDRLYANDDTLGLEYMSFGLWELGLDQAEADIGGAAFGTPTPTAAMPTGVTATYTGDLIGYNVVDGSTTTYVADSELVANFTTAEVTLSSSNTQALDGTPAPGFDLLSDPASPGTISGNGFSGTNLTIAALAGQAGDPLSGSFGGNFFGPTAEEAGGWFEMRNRSQPVDAPDRYFGSFGGVAP